MVSIKTVPNQIWDSSNWEFATLRAVCAVNIILIFLEILHTGSQTKQRNQEMSQGLKHWPQWNHTAVSVTSLLMGQGRLLSIYVCLSACQLPAIRDDWSDCGPDGLWWGWLDQVERYQTTHSGWHKLWGLSVLGGRGSTGTTEPLQSNILIRRQTDTPVHYRATETEVTETKREEGVVEKVHGQRMEEISV